MQEQTIMAIDIIAAGKRDQVSNPLAEWVISLHLLNGTSEEAISPRVDESLKIHPAPSRKSRRCFLMEIQMRYDTYRITSFLFETLCTISDSEA
jgi:hypothetical protein